MKLSWSHQWLHPGACRAQIFEEDPNYPVHRETSAKAQLFCVNSLTWKTSQMARSEVVMTTPDHGFILDHHLKDTCPWCPSLNNTHSDTGSYANAVLQDLDAELTLSSQIWIWSQCRPPRSGSGPRLNAMMFSSSTQEGYIHFSFFWAAEQHFYQHQGG